jgi:DNA repair protein RadC
VPASVAANSLICGTRKVARWLLMPAAMSTAQLQTHVGNLVASVVRESCDDDAPFAIARDDIPRGAAAAGDTPPVARDFLIDKPRERLWTRGVSSVTDDELLSIILGTGVRDRPALVVAAELVRATGGIVALSRASPRELSLVTGVGAARAARIAAAFELGRRAIATESRRATVGTPRDIFELIHPRVAGLSQELFFVIGVDIRNGLLDVIEIARGSVHGVEVHPREVFRPLVRMAAAGAVLAHNHPTGDPTPSSQDVDLTRRLRDVGNLLGIPIVDHVVIGDTTYRSIAEWLGTEL